jgi:outer membrane protein OmpA-like peptidoglycan-associated protein
MCTLFSKKSTLCLFATLLLTIGNTYSQDITPAEDEAIVKVTVSSIDGKPRKKDEITFISAKSGKTFKTITNTDGKSMILLKKADKYDVYYNNLNEKEKVQQFEIPQSEGKYTLNLSLKYDPPRTITLKNVFFDTGKASLRSESYAALNDLFDALKMKPEMIVEIAGHTDNVGSKSANQQLSEQRAVSVKKYLTQKGIDSKRIIAKGYGDTEAVADNDSNDGRQQNRRTEVRIVSE